MRLKLVVLVVVISFFTTGCSNNLMNVKKKNEDAKNCYEKYKTLFYESAMESLNILKQYDLKSTRLYASDNKQVYVTALEAEIQSEKLYEVLTQLAKLIIVSEDGVEFSLDSSGFVSNSDYSGIYYSPADNIDSLPLYLPYLEYVRENDIVTGAKEGSDNTVYIERIGEAFFYYYLTF